MTSPTNSDFFAALDNYVDEFGKIDLTNANSLRSVMAYLYIRFPNSMDLPANQSRLFWSGIWNGNIDATAVAFDLIERSPNITGQQSPSTVH